MWVAAKALSSFFFSPAGRTLLIVLAFLVWGAYQSHEATSDCREAQLREQLQESQRQESIARKIAAEARGRADAAETERERLEDLADDLIQDIENTTGSDCVVDPDLRERLLRIK